MIFAKLDVTIAYHQKAHRAGQAMATWAWALAYTREQELDGFIPAPSLRLSWVGEAQARKDMARLCDVGLAEADTARDGWVLSRYDSKNETKATIEARKESDRKRKGLPPKFQKNSDRNPTESIAGIPGSGSGSALVSGSSLEIASPDGSPPAWFDGACEAAAMSLGGVVDARPARWVEYLGSRSRKGWAKGHEDAVAWLSTVVRSERAKAAEAPRSRDAPRQQIGAAADAAWMNPTKNFDFGAGK